MVIELFGAVKGFLGLATSRGLGKPLETNAKRPDRTSGLSERVGVGSWLVMAITLSAFAGASFFGVFRFAVMVSSFPAVLANG
jgi:hypothetical protein